MLAVGSMVQVSPAGSLCHFKNTASSRYYLLRIHTALKLLAILWADLLSAPEDHATDWTAGCARSTNWHLWKRGKRHPARGGDGAGPQRAASDGRFRAIVHGPPVTQTQSRQLPSSLRSAAPLQNRGARARAAPRRCAGPAARRALHPHAGPEEDRVC